MFCKHPTVSLYIYSSIKFVPSYFNQNVAIFPEEIKGRKIKLQVKFTKSNEKGEKNITIWYLLWLLVTTHFTETFQRLSKIE